MLAGWASAQAWFAGRRRRVEAARLVEAAVVARAVPGAILEVLEIGDEDGGAARYLVAPALAEGAHATEIRGRSPQAVVATTAGARRDGR